MAFLILNEDSIAVEGINPAEERIQFHKKMLEISIDVPKSKEVHTLTEAINAMGILGLPLVVRSSGILGAKGVVLAVQEEAIAFLTQVFIDAELQMLTLEEALIGWRKYELEVLDDEQDKYRIVCGVEYLDPISIHAMDSGTTKPIQTLSENEYQKMRDTAFRVLSAVDRGKGGATVQFAVNPDTGRMLVVEMNLYRSRGSTLVSKAKCFPSAENNEKVVAGNNFSEQAGDMHNKHPKKTRHLLTGMELSPEELLSILGLAKRIKKKPKQYHKTLLNKNLIMIFEKPSFRTRLSFSLAMQSLGGHIVESVSNTRKQEEPRDLIRVLNGYADFVMIRTHADETLREMAKFATVPILNGLSALYHPCQILADLMTLHECFRDLKGLTLAYVGDGNNILNTLLLMAPQLGIKINYCCPAQHQPNQDIVTRARSSYEDLITAYEDPEAAVHHADVVYTDVWTSMGFENQSNEAPFVGFQVNESLMARAKPGALFMHCMPMERGKEVSTTLPDMPAAVLFTQSENRLHVQKALLIFLSTHCCL